MRFTAHTTSVKVYHDMDTSLYIYIWYISISFSLPNGMVSMSWELKVIPLNSFTCNNKPLNSNAEKGERRASSEAASWHGIDGSDAGAWLDLVISQNRGPQYRP